MFQVTPTDIADAQDQVLAYRGNLLVFMANNSSASLEALPAVLPSYFCPDDHTTDQLIGLAFAPGQHDVVIARSIREIGSRFVASQADLVTTLAHHIANVRAAREVADQIL